MALFPGLPRWAGTRKVKPVGILRKQETVSGSGISWAISKSTTCSRQITMPAPHHSVFTGRMPFLPPNQQRQSTEGNNQIKLIESSGAIHSMHAQRCGCACVLWTESLLLMSWSTTDKWRRCAQCDRRFNRTSNVQTAGCWGRCLITIRMHTLWQLHCPLSGRPLLSVS